MQFGQYVLPPGVQSVLAVQVFYPLTSHKYIGADCSGALDFGIDVLVVTAVVARVVSLSPCQCQDLAVGLCVSALTILFLDCLDTVETHQHH